MLALFTLYALLVHSVRVPPLFTHLSLGPAEGEPNSHRPPEWGIKAVFSKETPTPQDNTTVSSSLRTCDGGLGNAVFVTGAAGFLVSKVAVDVILERQAAADEVDLKGRWERIECEGVKEALVARGHSEEDAERHAKANIYAGVGARRRNRVLASNDVPNGRSYSET